MLFIKIYESRGFLKLSLSAAQDNNMRLNAIMTMISYNMFLNRLLSFNSRERKKDDSSRNWTENILPYFI